MPTLDEAAVRLLMGRHIAALATVRSNGLIHMTAVWYLYQDGDLLVPTSSRTQQFRNVSERHTASLMVDTRTPGFESGVTAVGAAEGLLGAEAQALARRVHERYLTPRAFSDPDVGASFETHDDAVIRLRPSSWVSWDMARLNAGLFGGRLGTESGYMFPMDEA